ncbi:MAG TPA: hypothetical protein ENK11_08415 [Phycisphaerales bacterium]|nr:hypothetical protein [Phycisphaerales bacterium]
MRNVFDRPTRRDCRIDDVVALDTTRFDRGYTPAERNRAMDRLLADLGLESPNPLPTRRPEVVTRTGRVIEREETRLTLAC